MEVQPTTKQIKRNGTIQVVSFSLPAVLYGCETWSLALREEHRLRVLENRVLRRIFGPKRDAMVEGWRKLLHNLYSSPNIIKMIKSRRMRWAGHAASMEEKRNAYGILVGKPEAKRLLERPSRRWEDIIKMNRRETGWGSMDRTDRKEWRDLVNTVMNVRVP
jgi:hypothetical protein